MRGLKPAPKSSSANMNINILVVDDEKEIADLVELYLKNEGYMLCEVGGYRQAHMIKNMLESTGFSANIKNDYSGKERVVIGLWINLS